MGPWRDWSRLENRWDSSQEIGLVLRKIGIVLLEVGIVLEKIGLVFGDKQRLASFSLSFHQFSADGNQRIASSLRTDEVMDSCMFSDRSSSIELYAWELLRFW